MKKARIKHCKKLLKLASKTNHYALALAFALQATISPISGGNLNTLQVSISQSSLMDPGNGPAIVKELDVTLTGYSSTPDQTDDTPFITASGKRVRDGIIASNTLPFGTKVQIPEIFGDKIFIVEDRMHRRFNNRVDIWFPDRTSALKFGKQKAMIVAFL